jgi:regulator of sigma E protease
MGFVSDLSDLWSMLQTIGYFLIALMIIVAVHELGHYWMGRICGIHAAVFSLGFGPTLVRRRDRHGTLWQIAALPLGGYVKFLGDADGASARPDEATLAGLSSNEMRHTLHGAPLWARMLTVIAGPAANIALTAVLLAGMILWQGVASDPPAVGSLRTVTGFADGLKPGDVITSVNGTPTPDLAALVVATQALPPLPEVSYGVLRGGQARTVVDTHPVPPLVLDVQPKSAALDAGIQPGDLVTALNGVPVHSFGEMPAIVAAQDGAPLQVTLLREGKTLDLTLTPRRRDLPDGNGGFETRWLIGLTGGALFDPATRTPGLIETAQMAGAATWGLITTNISGMGHVLTGAISTCNLSGPIGMAEVVGQAARSGFSAFVQILAIVSLAVGIMNLLPIPVLDGGHLMFHIYEVVFRRPPSNGAMQLLTTLGLALLLGLMVFALSNDLTCT